MPIRYRWYRIQVPGDYSDISKIITSKQLTTDDTFGFLHMEDSSDALRFRFLCRTKVLLTKFDDGDDPSYEEVASVSFTDFSIISVEGAIFLRVANPGRSLRDLLNGLETIIGFGFTSKPIMLKKLNMTAVFEAVDSVKMVGLKVSGAVINKDLVARIEFASKQGISVEKMKFLDGLKYAVEASAYELVYQGLRGQLAFSSSGLVKVSGSLAPRLVNLIEQDLPRMA